MSVEVVPEPSMESGPVDVEVTEEADIGSRFLAGQVSIPDYVEHVMTRMGEDPEIERRVIAHTYAVVLRLDQMFGAMRDMDVSQIPAPVRGLMKMMGMGK